jgi:hypothetical protein
VKSIRSQKETNNCEITGIEYKKNLDTKNTISKLSVRSFYFHSYLKMVIKTAMQYSYL